MARCVDDGVQRGNGAGDGACSGGKNWTWHFLARLKIHQHGVSISEPRLLKPLHKVTEVKNKKMRRPRSHLKVTRPWIIAASCLGGGFVCRHLTTAPTWVDVKLQIEEYLRIHLELPGYRSDGRDGCSSCKKRASSLFRMEVLWHDQSSIPRNPDIFSA